MERWHVFAVLSWLAALVVVALVLWLDRRKR